MNARSTETLHVIIIGSADGQDTLGSLDQDSPEGGIVPIGCPDPAGLGQVLRPLAAGTRVLLLQAGDRVEPGYLTSVAQHGTGEAVVLTPTVTIRPDGARDERLQWRFKHGNRTADLTVEPHIFPDTVSGAVLTIPRHGLQDWDGPGALHGGDDAAGVQTATDDEHTALSGLIAHIMATGNRVGLHDGPAVIRHAPQPPGPWGRIDHYRHLLGTVLPAWLQAGSPPPAWVHQLIIHRLIQVTDADRGLRYPSAGLTAAERAEGRIGAGMGPAAMATRAVRRPTASGVEQYASIWEAGTRRVTARRSWATSARSAAVSPAEG